MRHTDGAQVTEVCNNHAMSLNQPQGKKVKMKLPHTIIANINHLADNVADSIPQDIKTWADVKEFERVLDDHLKAVRKEMSSQ